MDHQRRCLDVLSFADSQRLLESCQYPALEVPPAFSAWRRFSSACADPLPVLTQLTQLFVIPILKQTKITFRQLWDQDGLLPRI